ncbi:YafY family protein [Rhizobium sp. BE258]|jgi:predicted DNA-binding transcriptional regulator YafY|uniref:helix-turn-helix transcriptional regulator n=1 Tax=unclassified Rhizobium TaxID=2613769 RepID=UPI000DD98A47|nr:YafY family protein [Rhizobium sp. BE258]MDR7143868.1 putative DNA-binding transcriptional regulator YafY [Rhizobium sp. BE258]
MPVSRSERLLALLQVLRRHRRPVSGIILAEQTGVSLRTLYRDIASLQSQGAMIEGEAGVGYVLKPGFMLPPMMFSEEELEALVLGSRWVNRSAEPRLAGAAADALAKIAAVLPAEMRETIESATLLVGPKRANEDKADVALIRKAIRTERILELHYSDEQGRISLRRVWPFALGYFEHIRMVMAWCELRRGFRHFRTDRIIDMTQHEERYPRRRTALMKEWREAEHVPVER